MKAITLKQPWATLVAEGIKPIETRTHARFKKLAGQTIAIHAGKTVSRMPFAFANHPLVQRIFDKYRRTGLPTGAVVATVYVQEARWLTAADSNAALVPAEGLFGLVMTNVKKFDTPIPAKGKQGIWEWNPYGLV